MQHFIPTAVFLRGVGFIQCFFFVNCFNPSCSAAAQTLCAAIIDSASVVDVVAAYPGSPTESTVWMDALCRPCLQLLLSDGPAAAVTSA